MRLFEWFSRLRWRVLLPAIACVGIVAAALLWPPKPVPFMVLRQPVQRPVLFRDHFARWIPANPSWAWAWRVEQAVFGKRKPVNISAQVIKFAEPPNSSLSNILGGPPSFSDTNGLQVWLLGADRCKRLGEQLGQSAGTSVLCQSRISTFDGIDSKLFQGTSITLNGTNKPVGLTLACFARVHRAATDLIACFSYSQAVTNAFDLFGGPSVSNVVSVQTNLDAALRLQIPKGSGFFLLDGAPLEQVRKRIGILVDPP